MKCFGTEFGLRNVKVIIQTFCFRNKIFTAIRAEITIALQQFLTNRLQIDESRSAKLGYTVRLAASESDFGDVYTSIALDLDLHDIAN